MAPTHLLANAIDRLICLTPKSSARAFRRSCRRIVPSTPLADWISASRNSPRSDTSIPKAFKVASLAAKQAAKRCSGLPLRLQQAISAAVNTPSQTRHRDRASSPATRLVSIRSVPNPTIMLLLYKPRKGVAAALTAQWLKIQCENAGDWLRRKTSIPSYGEESRPAKARNNSRGCAWEIISNLMRKNEAE